VFDSKLTRIIKPILSAESEIILTCFIYPLENNYRDTLDTLRFPNRVRGIHLQESPAKVVFSPAASVSRMHDIDEEEMQRQQAMVSQLAEENIALKAKLD
jgi:hypothetical protein